MCRPISCAHTRLRNTSLRHPHLFPLLIFYSSDFCKHCAFTHPKKGLCHKCHHPTLPLSEHRIDCARPVRTQGPAKVFPSRAVACARPVRTPGLAQVFPSSACKGGDTRPATTAKGDSSAASASTPHRTLVALHVQAHEALTCIFKFTYRDRHDMYMNDVYIYIYRRH